MEKSKHNPSSPTEVGEKESLAISKDVARVLRGEPTIAQLEEWLMNAQMQFEFEEAMREEQEHNETI